MRRYRIEVGGRPFDVDVEDAGGERFRVVVDGQSFDVALGASSEIASTAAVPRIVPAPAAPPAVRGNGQSAGDLLAAPMPGRILRLTVAAGASVRRGDEIAVLEAMKMENLIRAPRDGHIAEVCVQVGQQVAHGDAIVKFAMSGAPTP